MRKELGTLLLGAAILESCSTTPSPSPSPVLEVGVDYIVDCQANSLDDQYKIYRLKSGEIIRVGGITKDGKEDLVSIRAVGDGSFEFRPETNTFSGPEREPGALQIEDENFRIIVAAVLEENKTVMAVNIICVDAIPNMPQIPQT